MSLDPLSSLLAAVLVLLVGTLVNRRVGFLSKYNIPDPITGGLLFAVLASIALAASGFKLGIDQTIKPTLLLMFFAGVGMCADLRMLGKGGKALVIFLLVLFPFILVQNVVGIAAAMALDLHPIFGLVAGSITLVGGHGTGAAYAERFAEVNNLQAVMELSMTVATMGLIIGGVIAGPVAQYVINRHKLRSSTADRNAAEHAAEAPISTVGAVGALAGIFTAVIAGRWLAAKFAGAPITLPSFLWCMIIGVVIRNLLPFARVRCDDRASDLIAGVCLSLFLVMTVYVCFRFMGKDYEAAVTSAAFIGFSMGSTATAMANMQAITAKYGPAPQSYLIVPLSGAFFIDLMNALLLTAILSLPFMGG
jgi:ESS family glutamate:Na+ symporter